MKRLEKFLCYAIIAIGFILSLILANQHQYQLLLIIVVLGMLAAIDSLGN